MLICPLRFCKWAKKKFLQKRIQVAPRGGRSTVATHRGMGIPKKTFTVSMGKPMEFRRSLLQHLQNLTKVQMICALSFKKVGEQGISAPNFFVFKPFLASKFFLILKPNFLKKLRKITLKLYYFSKI